MKTYKAPDNSLHVIDPEFAYLLPAGCVEVTEAEAEAIRAANAPQLTLSQRQEQAWERIKQERDRRVQQGGYFAAGHWYHSDTFSRTQQLGLVMLGANIPDGIQWKTMDDGFVAMTPALAAQIFAAATASDKAHFEAAEVHKTAMLASADPESYDFSTGWPVIFE